MYPDNPFLSLQAQGTEEIPSWHGALLMSEQKIKYDFQGLDFNFKPKSLLGYEKHFLHSEHKVRWWPQAMSSQKASAALQLYLCSVCVLVLQLLHVQLIDLSKNQKLPVQELHLLLHRFTVGKLERESQSQTLECLVLPEIHSWHALCSQGAVTKNGDSNTNPQLLDRLAFFKLVSVHTELHLWALLPLT